ncbi:MAG: GNAT family N-acetyltransferase [Maricaulaceae bacterium]|nr:GNAT family N-acetyltransferase [Maricaulaceae bacterium]
MGVIRIDIAGPEAAEDFAALHARCFDHAWSAAEFAALLSHPHNIGFVARNGGGAPAGIALICAAADEADILTVAAAPEHRREGLGASLLAACEDEAKRAGAAKIFLDVSARNEAALGLYTKAGYRKAAERPRYYSDGSDALLFEKPLA